MYRIRIAITLPNGIKKENTIAWKCYTKLSDTEELKFHDVVVQGAIIGKNRNLCVSRSKLKIQSEFDFDYILFVDSDIAFTIDDIQKLIKDDLQIVSGAYSDGHEHYEAGYWKEPMGLIKNKIKSSSKTIECVDWCGAGFLLIKKEVFENTLYPWFYYPIIDSGIECEIAGEDFGFAMKVKLQDYKIWIDCDCILEHGNEKKIPVLFSDIVYNVPQYLLTGKSELLAAIDNLSQYNFPISICDKLLIIKKEIINSYDRLQQHKKNVAEKYGVNGRIDQNCPKYTEACKKLEEIFSTKIQLNLPEITLKKSDEIKMKAYELESLKPFVNWVE